MGTLQYTRVNDQWPGGSPSIGRPDLSPALGTWFNCNANTGEIVSLTLIERGEGLILRALGAGNPSKCDWGETSALPHVSGLGSREVSGFTAHYDFEFMETQIAANLKYGVLVIQSYNTFRDGSGRPAYFSREFFHQKMNGETPVVHFQRPADAPATPPQNGR